MTYIKKIGKSLLYMLGSLLILLLFFTILNYIGLLNHNTMKIIKFIISLISIILGSFIFGKNSKNKGWLEGLKLGSIILIILIVFNYLIFNIEFSIKHIVYYGIILGTSILGSILGINKRKLK